MPTKTSPKSNKTKTNSSTRKPIQKTDGSKIRALEEQLAQREVEIARLSTENRQLAKEKEQRATELQIINNIGQTLTEGLDLNSIAKRVVDRLHEALKVENIAITVINANTGEIIIRENFYLTHPSFAADRFSLDKFKYLMRLSARGDDRSWVVNTKTEKSWRKFIANIHEGDTAPKSFVALPLLAGGDAIGGIIFANYEKENAFADISISMLETIASNLGTAIQNARLFEETQRLLKETEQRATELQIINNIGQTLTEGLDLNSTLERVGERLREVLKVEHIGIIAFDPKTDLIIAQYLRSKLFTSDQVSLSKFRLRIRLSARGGARSWVVNTNAEKSWRKFGADVGEGDEIPKSFVALPLLAGREMIGGILFADYERENAFTDISIGMLETIASNMGTAIQNVRLFDETQHLLKQTEQRATELQIINNIGQTLTEGLDLNTTIERVGERLREALKIENIGIAAFDPKNDLVIAQYMVRNGKQITGDQLTASKFKFGIRLASRRAGRSWVVNTNLEKSWRKFGQIKEEPRIPKSWVMLPLLAGGEVIGGISIADFERENAFADLPLGMLETIASNMGTTVQNVRLFEETQRLLKQTEQRATELQIINNIGQTLTEGGDLDSMIQRVGERIQEALNVKDIVISLFDEKTSHVLSPYMVRNGKQIEITEENIDLRRFKLGIRASARAGGRSWVVNKVAEKTWRKWWISMVDNEVPKSFVTLPLLAGREVIGGITIADYESENAFSDLSVNLLETIASNMGTAVQNVRLFDETKNLFNEAQEARAAAEHANKAKSTFLANMSHELRTPLNAIMGFTSIVRKKAEGVLPEKQTENLDKVMSSSQHLLGLINTALDIAKIEAGRMDVIPAKFNLSGLADQCANIAIPLLKPDVSLEKQVDETIGIIFSDQDKIKQIVLNLLSNAAKFTHNGRILLSVEKSNDENVNISVTDSGIGISKEALGRVFEEFQQADNTTTRQYGGTGLGLAISRNLARLLGGDLTATSELGKGSTFTLIIPIQYGKNPASPSNPKPASVQLTESHAPAKTTNL